MTAAAILAELEALCAHEAFATSSRQTALLRFVVTAVLEGRADQLKEYSVGVGALGRPTSFDPKLDSSVRSEASRMRAKLDALYAAEPNAHPVRIQLPKGHYVPTFESRPQALTASPDPESAWPPPGAPAVPLVEPTTRRGVVSFVVVMAIALLALVSWPRGSRPPDDVAPSLQVRRFDAFNTDRQFPKISPDGRLVVYSQRDGGQPFLFLSRADAPAAPVNQQGEHAAWSADGRQLAFRSDRDGGGLFVMDVATKEVRQVTSDGFHPAWSPDGMHLVYSSERYSRPEARLTTRSTLTVLNVTTGTTRGLPLPPPMDDAIEPAWSPDGRWIAFWSIDTGGRRGVFVMPAVGGRPVRVTEPDALDWNPTWAPDGRLYWSSNLGGANNLWRARLDADGAVVGRPEAVPLPATYAGFFSFDGRGQLMYANVQAMWSIYRSTLGTDGGSASSMVRLTPETLRVRNPSPSPDGQHITGYTLDPQEDLVVFRRDGSGLRRLTNDAFRDRGPAWSPDGRRIAFVSNRGGDYQLWSVQPDGQGLTSLTENPAGAFGPVWSRDGERLAWFERARRVKLSRVAGSNATSRDLPGQASFTPSAWWHADAALLGALAATDDDEDTPLVSATVETGRLQDLGIRGRAPRWLVEGRVLLYLRGNTFVRHDVTSGEEQPVLALPGAVSNRYALAADGTLYFDMQESRVELWTARLP